MPGIEEIRQFNKTVTLMGNEPHIASQRGEPLEDPKEPEQGLSEDLESLLGDVPDEPDESDDDGNDALSALLDDIGAEDDDESPDEEAPVDDDPFAAVDLGDDPDFEDDPDFDVDEPLDLAEEPDEPEEPLDLAEEPLDFDEEPLDFDEEPDEPLDLDEEPEAPQEPEPPEPEDDEDDLSFLEDDDLTRVDPPAQAMDLEEFDDEDAVDFDAEAVDDEASETVAPPDDEDDFSFGFEEDVPFELEEEEEIEDAEPADLDEEPAELGEGPGDDISFDLPDDDELEELDVEGDLDLADEDADDEGSEEFDVGDFGDFGMEEEEDFSDPGEIGAVDDEDDEIADVSEFSLGDFGQEFGVIEEDDGAYFADEEELNPAAALPMEAPKTARQFSDADDEDAPIVLSDKDFSHVKQTLDSLPLNLRIATEEIISDEDKPPGEIRPLLRALIKGSTPKDIARIAGGIKGERIRLPSNYAVRRGVVFEEEKATFAYQFRHRILPLARTVALVALLIGVVTWLGVRFVYQPLYARYLYQQGLAEIDDSRYDLGNEFFDQASRLHERQVWFIRYADAFIGRRQYQLAREKFEQLVNSPRYRHDREGLLRWAALESEVLGEFARAEALLQRYIQQHGPEYLGLRAEGDNYLRWADADPTPERFNSALETYTLMVQLFGPQDEILERLLWYHVRRDNPGPVLELVTLFEEVRTEAPITPKIYAEAAGYLIDRDRITFPRDMLRRILRTDPRSADAYYQYGRFFRRMGESRNEITALEDARTLLSREDLATARRRAMFIDTHTLIAEFHLREGRVLQAEDYYSQAVDLFTSENAAGLLRPDHRYGRMFAGFGDLFFDQTGEYDSAEQQYRLALQHRYGEGPRHDADTVRYRLGWIAFRDDRYREALDRFESISGATRNPNLAFARANTHYFRNQFVTSQSYLQDVLAMLETERRSIGDDFNVNREPAHRELVQFRAMASNNLGVVMHRIFEQSGDRNHRADALVALTNSTQDATDLGRNPQTAVRSEATDLAFLNQRYVLFPDQDFDLRVYRSLPRDLSDRDFFPARL
ncbi:MAG: hypothetical protein EA383_01460 [Spirochaetaceae bacterium]|nr:MAG: hypothetical protein EA383_01460 [Spirochaetaceae bacterium]